MHEMVQILLNLKLELKAIKLQLEFFKKSQTEILKESWIDAQDVMQALKISKRTLQKLRDNGTLPFTRINGKFYYKVSDIEKTLEANYTKKNIERGNNESE